MKLVSLEQLAVSYILLGPCLLFVKVSKSCRNYNAKALSKSNLRECGIMQAEQLFQHLYYNG